MTDADNMLKRLLESADGDFEAYRNDRPTQLELSVADARAVFCLDNLETYLFCAGVAGDADLFRLAHDGVETAGPLPCNDDILLGLASGATLALHGIHRRWIPAARAADAFSHHFGAFVTVNAYAMLTGGQTFPVHYDSNDLYVVQTDGRKRWQVYRQNRVADTQSDAPDDLGEPLVDVELAAGDALYLPRGHYHRVQALGEGSCHLTFGVQPLRLGDLLQHALGPRRGLRSANQELDAIPAEDRSRQLRDMLFELHPLLEEDAFSQGIQSLISSDLERLQPLPGNYLKSLRDVDLITADTRLQHRPGFRMRVLKLRDTAVLLGPRQTVRFPAKLENAIDRVVDREPFSARDLSTNLTESAALALVRELVLRGLIEVTDEKDE